MYCERTALPYWQVLSSGREVAHSNDTTSRAKYRHYLGGGVSEYLKLRKVFISSFYQTTTNFYKYLLTDISTIENI